MSEHSCDGHVTYENVPNQVSAVRRGGALGHNILDETPIYDVTRKEEKICDVVAKMAAPLSTMKFWKPGKYHKLIRYLVYACSLRDWITGELPMRSGRVVRAGVTQAAGGGCVIICDSAAASSAQVAMRGSSQRYWKVCLSKINIEKHIWTRCGAVVPAIPSAMIGIGEGLWSPVCTNPVCYPRMPSADHSVGSPSCRNRIWL